MVNTQHCGSMRKTDAQNLSAANLSLVHAFGFGQLHAD
jgi:hypothetical protein